MDSNALHLINRSSFGPKLDWIEVGNNSHIIQNLNVAQKWLFDSLEVYEPLVDSDCLDLSAEQKKEYFRLKNQDPTEAMVADWLAKMVGDNNNLREVSALFWHHHIPCTKGNDRFRHSRLLLELYRKYSLEDLRTLLIKVSENPAMMYMLDGHHSHKSNPNENFPRELLELYTLGSNNFSTKDVKEVARAYTGRRFDHYNYPYKMFVDMAAFDNGEKIIFGKKGKWSGNDVIDLILDQPDTSKHITKSALIFFLGKIPKRDVLDKCSKIYFESGYNFKELLKSIFLSSWFYEDEYKMNKVKTPVELLVGFQRKTGLRCNGIKTTNYFLKSCGQRLFYPPNISGWPYGNGWLYGEALVNRVFLPGAYLQIANRNHSRSTLIYKLTSRVNKNDLRGIRYIADCTFDKNHFLKVIADSGVYASYWINGLNKDGNDLVSIFRNPKHQYS